MKGKIKRCTCGWPCKLGQRGRFKVPVFLSTRDAAVIDEKEYRIGFISAAYFCPSPTVFASKDRICALGVFRLSIFKCGCTSASQGGRESVRA